MDPKELKALRFRPSPRLRRIRAALIAGIGLAVLAVLYSTYWFVLATGARAQLLSWAEDRRAMGFDADLADVRASGFPFDVHLAAANVRLGNARADTPWLWESRAAVLSLKPWNPFRITLKPSGDQNVTATVRGEKKTFRGSGALTATFTLAGAGMPDDVAVTVKDLNISNGGVELIIGAADLRARVLERGPADYRTPVFDLALDAQTIRLPATVNLALGTMVSRLTLSGVVMGSFGDGFEGGNNPGALGDRLGLWRDAGGTVDITRFETAYGPLVIRTSGTIALDRELQPVGAFTAKVEGFQAVVEALRRKGLVRSRDAVTAKIVLGALARKNGSGSPTLNLPVTVQKRKFYAGPIPLLELPEITWD